MKPITDNEYIRDVEFLLQKLRVMLESKVDGVEICIGYSATLHEYYLYLRSGAEEVELKSRVLKEIKW